jgi:hypothetical protein
MQLIFTKGAEKSDLLTVQRANADAEEIVCPKQRIIPHDMVHFAVEHWLEQRGFLSRVRDGERAAFTMQPEATSDAVERLVEVFQGDAWSGSTTPAEEMIDLYRVTCQARECPMLEVSAADIDAVRQRMAELTVQWEAVPVGGQMRLQF